MYGGVIGDALQARLKLVFEKYFSNLELVGSPHIIPHVPLYMLIAHDSSIPSAPAIFFS